MKLCYISYVKENSRIFLCYIRIYVFRCKTWYKFFIHVLWVWKHIWTYVRELWFRVRLCVWKIRILWNQTYMIFPVQWVYVEALRAAVTHACRWCNVVKATPMQRQTADQLSQWRVTELIEMAGKESLSDLHAALIHTCSSFLSSHLLYFFASMMGWDCRTWMRPPLSLIGLSQI